MTTREERIEQIKNTCNKLYHKAGRLYRKRSELEREIHELRTEQFLELGLLHKVEWSLRGMREGHLVTIRGDAQFAEYMDFFDDNFSFRSTTLQIDGCNVGQGDYPYIEGELETILDFIKKHNIYVKLYHLEEVRKDALEKAEKIGELLKMFQGDSNDNSN